MLPAFPRSIPTHLWKKPPKQRLVTQDQDKNLIAILDYIKDCKLTLGSFVEACLSSDEIAVRRKVDYFYSNGSPARCLDLWRDDIKEEHTGSLLKSALNFVLKYARPEIERASHTVNLKLPASSVSADALDQFSLQDVEKELAEHAPTSFALLRGLINDKRPSPFEQVTPAVSVIGSMVLKTWNKQANFLQSVFGLYFYSQGASKSLINVLQKAGICNSFNWIMEGLDHMTEAHLARVQAILRDKKQSFMVVYDNINMAFRRYNQRTTNQDSFENGATATVILTSEMPTVERTQDPTRHLRASDLLPTTAQSDHLKDTYRYHLTEVLQRQAANSVKNPFSEPVKNKLKVERTEAYPLPSMHIDQSTVDGNKDILDDIMKSIELNPESWFDALTRMVIAGDQLTLARIRSIAKLRWDEKKAYYRVEWAIPVLQLFHLQMVLASTILKTHWGSQKTPGSLSYFITILEKKRISQDKPNFHDLDELLRHVFDAMVLLLWETELNTENLSAKVSSQPPKSTEDIKDKVDGILKQYLTTSNLHNIANQQSINAALFIRDMLLYIELGSAIKAGDIGRIEEIIRWLTLVFQAGGTKNYANELLRLHCGISYSWKGEEKDVILSSMLVNTTGQPNRWIPTDLYQEHNNLLTKVVHAAKSSNLNWEILKKKISTNVRTFQDIAAKMEKVFKTPHNGTNHSAPSSAADITMIKTLCIQSGIFTSGDKSPGLVVLAVKDLLQAGLKNITDNKRIADFKKYCGRHCREETGEIDIDMAEEEDVEMEDTAVPGKGGLEEPELEFSQFDVDEFVISTYC
ncbi:hypothetical protein BGZ83_002139 [Gryganskiella cystojenkinii]|nr:hypothetical protein BGZ83_002139 [Gryganskiella cystojenkinii]